MITVYVLRGENGRRYVGITNDLPHRLAEHKRGRTKGGQLLKDFTVIHTEEHPDYPTARAREIFLKSGKGRAWLDDFDGGMRPARGG